MDKLISYQLNQFVGKSQFLDFIFFITADWLPYIAVILFYWLFSKKKYFNKNIIIITVFALIAGLISRFVFAEIIYYFLDRPRPFVVDQNIVNLLAHNSSDSFPSGHASFFFPFPMILYLFDKKLGVKLMILIILMGIARIIVGVHWASDILAGAIIGIITSISTYRLFLTKYRTKFIHK